MSAALFAAECALADAKRQSAELENELRAERKRSATFAKMAAEHRQMLERILASPTYRFVGALTKPLKRLIGRR